MTTSAPTSSPNPAAKPAAAPRALREPYDGAGGVPRWARVLLLVVLVVAAMFPVLSAEFLAWDDGTSIAGNPDFLPPRLESLGHYWIRQHLNFYVPVTYTVLWLLSHVAVSEGAGGVYTLSPVPFHAANLVVHAANAVLLYLLLRKLVRRDWAAWLGAALFGLHPIQVEPVAWATSTYSSLSGFFSLLTALAYFRFSDAIFGQASALTADKDAKLERSVMPEAAWAWLVVVAACYGLALLTKPTIILLPAILGVMELGLRGRKVKDVAAPLGGLLLFGAMPIAFVTQYAQPTQAVYSPLLLRPVVAADAVAMYLRNMLLPVWLAPDYGRSPRWLEQAGNVRYLTWLAPTAALAVGALLWRRTRWPLVALAVMVLALLPMLGLAPFDFQRYSTVADRYAYFAMIAPAMLLAAALARWWSRGLAVAVAVVLAALLGASHVQARHWHDSERFHEYVTRRNPRSLWANLYMIHKLVKEGRHDEALDNYRAAAKLNPDDPELLYNMGNVCLRKQRFEEAVACFRRAGELWPLESRIFSNLAVAYAQSNRPGEALAAAGEAIELDPRNADAHLNAAIILAGHGRLDDAARHYREVIRLNGNVAAARRGLAQIGAPAGPAAR